MDLFTFALRRISSFHGALKKTSTRTPGLFNNYSDNVPVSKHLYICKLLSEVYGNQKNKLLTKMSFTNFEMSIFLSIKHFRVKYTIFQIMFI